MIKLTVVITTYNLEEYVEEAIQSILKQKVNFEYKIRISDDCSTDHTIDIIKSLQEKYPDKIELLLSDRNGGSLKNSNKAFEGVKSEYIAFLDGDDFWLGEDKLQRKIDFLDSHKEYALCGGDTVMTYKDGSTKQMINVQEDMSYEFNDYLKGKVPFVHTSSLVLRNIIYSEGMPHIYYDVEKTFENCAVRGETFRFVTHLEKGKLMVFADTMSCYRIHEKGIWQGTSETKRQIETAISGNFYDKYYKDLQEDTFRRLCISSYRDLMRHLIDQRIYSYYSLTEQETYLLTEYLNDVAKRDIGWTKDGAEYIYKQPKVGIVRRVWRAIRKKLIQ